MRYRGARVVVALCAAVLAGVAHAATESEDGVHLDADGRLVLDSLSAKEPLGSRGQVESWADSLARRSLGFGERDTLQLSAGRAGLNGHTYYRAQQMYADRPVIGFDTALVIEPDGQPGFMLGRHMGLEDPPTEPDLPAAAAIEAAGVRPLPDDEPTLVYYPVAGSDVRLAWRIDGFTPGLAGAARSRIYVDALSGERLGAIPLVHKSLNRSIIDFRRICRNESVARPIEGPRSDELVDKARRIGLGRSEGDSPAGSTRVDRAYDLLGALHTFLDEQFGMDSLDDKGRKLEAVVGVRFLPGRYAGIAQCGGNVPNAFWDREKAFLPDSMLSLVEVVAHEFGHGIISSTGSSDLVYDRESGALNESIADIVGVTFRAWYESGGRKDRPPSQLRVRDRIWQLRFPAGSGVLRDLSAPRRIDNNPDHYDQIRRRGSTQRPATHVHTNSSIINHAWYLMAEGGRHRRLGTGPDVEAIGLSKTARIAVLATTSHLSSDSNFRMAREAIARAARDLFGEYSTEWRSVHEALDAVGVPGTWSPAPPKPKPDPSPTPTPEKAPEPKTDPKPDTDGDTGTGISDFWLAGILLLLVLAAVALILYLRPRHAGRSMAPVVAARTDAAGGSARPQPAPPSPEAGESMPRAQWALKALDGSESIPVAAAWLDGSDGLVIGRAPELVHVCMESRQVSRRHVRLLRHAGELYVEDMRSSHGTALDGKPLEPFRPQPLRPGQFLRIAGFSYQLVTGDHGAER